MTYGLTAGVGGRLVEAYIHFYFYFYYVTHPKKNDNSKKHLCWFKHVVGLQSFLVNHIPDFLLTLNNMYMQKNINMS